jgi:hypothetical protein
MDHIHLGETVDVTTPYSGTWRGEVIDVDEANHTANVRCLAGVDRPGGMKAGTSLIVALTGLTRAGDPEGMREDGCDDVDVTGRVRPCHRHAVTGEAHAHPNGDRAHTHRSPAMDLPRGWPVTTTPGPGPIDERPDPVEILAREIATWRYANEGHHRTVTSEDRDVAREMLAALVAGPWHLVLINDPGTARGIVDLEWKP